MLSLTFEAADMAAERAHDERAWLAWHTARLVQYNPKKFPKLKTLLGVRRKRTAPQTWEQQYAIVKMLNAALGGTDIEP